MKTPYFLHLFCQSFIHAYYTCKTCFLCVSEIKWINFTTCNSPTFLYRVTEVLFHRLKYCLKSVWGLNSRQKEIFPNLSLILYQYKSVLSGQLCEHITSDTINTFKLSHPVQVIHFSHVFSLQLHNLLPNEKRKWLDWDETFLFVIKSRPQTVVSIQKHWQSYLLCSLGNMLDDLMMWKLWLWRP